MPVLPKPLEIYRSKANSDVTIVCKDGYVYCHQWILSHHSTFFRRFFEESQLLYAIELEIPEFAGVPPSIKYKRVPVHKQVVILPDAEKIQVDSLLTMLYTGSTGVLGSKIDYSPLKRLKLYDIYIQLKLDEGGGLPMFQKLSKTAVDTPRVPSPEIVIEREMFSPSHHEATSSISRSLTPVIKIESSADEAGQTWEGWSTHRSRTDKGASSGIRTLPRLPSDNQSRSNMTERSENPHDPTVSVTKGSSSLPLFSAMEPTPPYLPSTPPLLPASHSIDLVTKPVVDPDAGMEIDEPAECSGGSGRHSYYPAKPSTDKGGSASPSYYPEKPSADNGGSASPSYYPLEPSAEKGGSTSPSYYPSEPSAEKGGSASPSYYPSEPYYDEKPDVAALAFLTKQIDAESIMLTSDQIKQSPSNSSRPDSAVVSDPDSRHRSNQHKATRHVEKNPQAVINKEEPMSVPRKGAGKNVEGKETVKRVKNKVEGKVAMENNVAGIESLVIPPIRKKVKARGTVIETSKQAADNTIIREEGNQDLASRSHADSQVEPDKVTPSVHAKRKESFDDEKEKLIGKPADITNAVNLGKEVSSILEVVPKPPIAQTDDKVTTEGSKDEDELVCGNTDFMDTDYQSIDPEKVSDDLGLDKSDDLLTDELRNSIMDNIAGLGESSIDGLINSPERKDNRVDSTVLEAYSRHDNNVQESALSDVEPDKDADLSDDQSCDGFWSPPLSDSEGYGRDTTGSEKSERVEDLEGLEGLIGLTKKRSPKHRRPEPATKTIDDDDERLRDKHGCKSLSVNLLHLDTTLKTKLLSSVFGGRRRRSAEAATPPPEVEEEIKAPPELEEEFKTPRENKEENKTTPGNREGATPPPENEEAARPPPEHQEVDKSPPEKEDQAKPIASIRQSSLSPTLKECSNCIEKFSSSKELKNHDCVGRTRKKKQKKMDSRKGEFDEKEVEESKKDKYREVKQSRKDEYREVKQSRKDEYREVKQSKKDEYREVKQSKKDEFEDKEVEKYKHDEVVEKEAEKEVGGELAINVEFGEEGSEKNKKDELSEEEIENNRKYVLQKERLEELELGSLREKEARGNSKLLKKVFESKEEKIQNEDEVEIKKEAVFVCPVKTCSSKDQAKVYLDNPTSVVQHIVSHLRKNSIYKDFRDAKGVLPCQDCSYTEKSVSKFITHQALVHQEMSKRIKKALDDEDLDKKERERFESVYAFIVPYLSGLPSSALICKLCPKAFVEGEMYELRKHALLRHLRNKNLFTETEQAIICTVCDQSFKARKEVEKHLATTHAEAVDQAVEDILSAVRPMCIIKVEEVKVEQEEAPRVGQPQVVSKKPRERESTDSVQHRRKERHDSGKRKEKHDVLGIFSVDQQVSRKRKSDASSQSLTVEAMKKARRSPSTTKNMDPKTHASIKEKETPKEAKGVNIPKGVILPPVKGVFLPPVKGVILPPVKGVIIPPEYRDEVDKADVVIKEKEVGPLRCTKCSYQYEDIPKLRDHLTNKHADSYPPVKLREGGVKFFECDEFPCEFKTKTERDFSLHLFKKHSRITSTLLQVEEYWKKDTLDKIMFLKPVDSSFTDTELDISIPIIIDIPLEFNSSDDVTEVMQQSIEIEMMDVASSDKEPPPPNAATEIHDESDDSITMVTPEHCSNLSKFDFEKLSGRIPPLSSQTSLDSEDLAHLSFQIPPTGGANVKPELLVLETAGVEPRAKEPEVYDLSDGEYVSDKEETEESICIFCDQRFSTELDLSLHLFQQHIIPLSEQQWEPFVITTPEGGRFMCTKCSDIDETADLMELKLHVFNQHNGDLLQEITGSTTHRGKVHHPINLDVLINYKKSKEAADISEGHGLSETVGKGPEFSIDSVLHSMSPDFLKQVLENVDKNRGPSAEPESSRNRSENKQPIDCIVDTCKTVSYSTRDLVNHLLLNHGDLLAGLAAAKLCSELLKDDDKPDYHNYRSKYFESKKLFFCRLTEECAFVTESIKIIQQHEKYHQQDNRKQCGKCSVFFESRSILKDHAKTCCFDKFIARIDALKVSLGMATIKKEPRRSYEAPSLSCTHQVKGCAQMFSDRRILHDHASKCEFRPKKFGTCHECVPARSYFYEKDYNDHFNKKHPKSRASKSRTTTPNPRHPSQKSRSTSRDQGHPLRPPYSTRATTPESRELRHESHSNNSRSWTPVQSEMSGSRPMPTPSDVRIHPRSLGPSIRRSHDDPGASGRRLSRDDPGASARWLSHDRPGVSRDHQRDLFDYPPENRPLERPRRRVRDNNSSEERRGDEPPRYRTRQNSTEERPGDETRYRGRVNDMSDVRRGHLSPEFPEMAPSINCNECPLKFTSIQDAMNHQSEAHAGK